MSFRTIDDPKLFPPLYEKLKSCFAGGEGRTQRLGIQNSGWNEPEVLWFSALGIWARFNPRWRDPVTWPGAGQVAAGCVFGTADLSSVDPSEGVPITLEMNFPMEKMDRSFGGRFIIDSSGAIHVAHSGKVNRVGKDSLLALYPEKSRLIKPTPHEPKNRPLIYLGPLDHTLPPAVSQFVHWVAKLK